MTSALSSMDLHE
jgi:hypothetical protein